MCVEEQRRRCGAANTLPPPSPTDTQLCRHIFTSSPRTQPTVTSTRERIECDSCLDDASPSSDCVISSKRSSTTIPPQRRLLRRCRRACEFRPCCYPRTRVVICVVCRHGSIYIVGGNIVFCNNLFSQASTGKMVGLSRCRWRWGKVGLTGPSHLNCFSWLLLDRTFLSGLTLLAHCEPT